MKKKYTINQESKSYLANLLATERLEVQYKKTQTASFDVKSRVLTIPIWKKDLSEPVTDLFVSHEVGHALYTPMSLLIKSKKLKINHSIVNVVEDARIEKLIKRKYNGLRQTYIRGYKELIADNFFGTQGKDINEYLLIDRLNIHFKSSHVSSNVKFTDEEMKYVEMMNKLETPEDVIKVSKLLQEYCNQEKEETGREQQIEFDKHELEEVSPEEMTDEEKENSINVEETEDTAEDNAQSKESKSNDEAKSEDDSTDEVNNGIAGASDDSAISETDVAWEQTKNQILDSEALDNDYCSIHSFSNTDDYITDYKEVLSDFKKLHIDRMTKKNKIDPYDYSRRESEGYEQRYSTSLAAAKSEYRKFAKTSLKTVMYLVKEFEMKKSAALYARATTARTGVVDTLKLHSYKYADDIFKKISVVPDGKNHGLMLLLDWSGSMYDKILPTVEQLINLTMFCRKINVPFEVYAFTNNSENESYDQEKQITYRLGDIMLDERFRLVNWASSRMNNKDFEENMFNLYALARRFNQRNSRHWEEQDPFDVLQQPYSYHMSSTPLNDALMIFHKLVPAFIKKYSIEKMNTVLLTDGHSDRGAQRWDPTSRHLGRRNSNLILISKKTRKQYNLNNNGYHSRDLTSILIENLREETGTKIVGFYLQSKKAIEIYNFNHSHGESNKYGKYLDFKTETALKLEWRKNKCIITDRKIHDTPYDEHYTISSNNLKVSDEEMATPSENAKTGELKRLFAKSRNSSLQSRMILNRFIKLVA